MADSPTQLEREFAELARDHNLTRIDIGFCGDAYGPGHRFIATAHFDDAMPGQIPCGSGHGDTIDAAIESMLPVLQAKRTTPGTDVQYGAVAEAA